MKTIILTLIVFTNTLFTQWIQQTVPTDVEMVLSLDFTDLSHGVGGGWKFGFAGKAVYTTNSGVNWIMASLPESSRSIVKIQMINSTTGYIAGASNTLIGDLSTKQRKYADYFNTLPPGVRKSLSDIGMLPFGAGYKGIFLKTTNGGQSWFTYGALPANVYYLLGMKFVNLNTGFVSASLTYSGIINDGILKTTNGGLSWVNQLSLDTSELGSIYTADGITVYAGGWGRVGSVMQGFILKSTNGGSSWARLNFSNIDKVNDVYFTNVSTGFAVSNNGMGTGLIFKTTNGGSSWNTLNYQSQSTIYDGIELVIGTGKGVAVGSRFGNNSPGVPLVSRTTNYGVNWSTITINDSDNFLHSQKLIDQNNWFICGIYGFNL